MGDIVIGLIFLILVLWMLFMSFSFFEAEQKRMKLKNENEKLKDENKGLRIKLEKVEPSDVVRFRRDLRFDNWKEEEDMVFKYQLAKGRVTVNNFRDKIVLDSAKYEILSKGMKHIRKCENMVEVQSVLEKVDIEFKNDYIGLEEVLKENRMLKRLREGETMQVIGELQFHIGELEEITDMLTGSYGEFKEIVNE